MKLEVPLIPIFFKIELHHQDLSVNEVNRALITYLLNYSVFISNFTSIISKSPNKRIWIRFIALLKNWAQTYRKNRVVTGQ